ETKPFYTVVFVETSSILRSFQSAKQSRIFQLYMVNPKGEVLLHSDEDILRSEKNFSDIPIVSGMMENKIMYGSRKYFYNGIEYLGSFNVLKKENLGIVSTAKSDLVYSAVYKIQRQNILILIIILTLSFVLVYFYSRTITSPIMNLMGAVIQLEEGDYDLKIRPESGDEIGILTASFLSAANRLKERNQVKQILGKFVNLNQKITAKLLSASPEHGGNKKECTILYANIRNFSELSETYSADRIVSILNDYYTKMVDCIYKNDGIVDKFIGNSFMAHWGALYKSDNDPVNAVKTALEMRNTLIPYNRRCSELGKPQFRFGCGINTGDAIAGKLGGDQNAEFTVIGGAVNLATKIENLSIDFNTDILITEATKHAVENWFRLVELEPVILSGHKEELKLYAVLGEKSDPGCPSSFDELRKLIHV
ncbi:MAG: HAMP domain-containing protein, partial [Spirochaetia bacterium]|nr:HAMP domain-containing protein [Spirochaetia bacterium]